MSHEHTAADVDQARPGHTHGALAARTSPELRVLMGAAAILLTAGVIEIVIAGSSRSAAILADGLHNLGDVATTLALALAFVLSRRAANARYPYGYHRAEDLAALLVLLVIVASAVAAAYTSVDHLIHPAPTRNLLYPAIAAAVAFAANEVAAIYKTRAGRRLGSVGLVADGQHSRIDGLASLGALAGIGGVAAGFPMADPLAGLAISVGIVLIAWETGRSVTSRLMDAVDAGVLEAMVEQARTVEGVVGVTDPRARWTGRRLHLDLNIELDSELHLHAAHDIAEQVRQALCQERPGVTSVRVHIDPAGPPRHSRSNLEDPG